MAETGSDVDEISRNLIEQNALLFQGALADQALAQLDDAGVGAIGIAGKQLQLEISFDLRKVINGALVGVDERRQLGQKHLADRAQLALTLEHAGELGEVGLQPVLLAVAL